MISTLILLLVAMARAGAAPPNPTAAMITQPASKLPAAMAAPAPIPAVVAPAPAAPAMNIDNLKGIIPGLDAAKDRKPEERSVDDVLKIRDPFKRPILAPAGNTPKHPLLKFATNEYKMVGVLKGKGPTRAIVLAPDGTTYFVKRLDKIGVQMGTVTDITSQHIEVSEKIPNILGKYDDMVTLIQLPPDTALGAANAVQEAQAQNANEEVYMKRDRTANPRGGMGVGQSMNPVPPSNLNSSPNPIPNPIPVFNPGSNSAPNPTDLGGSK